MQLPFALCTLSINAEFPTRVNYNRFSKLNNPFNSLMMDYCAVALNLVLVIRGGPSDQTFITYPDNG